MRIYTIKAKQIIPLSLEKTWEFFSSPANLQKITPPYMGFEITSGEENRTMYAGQIITYIVRPLFNLPVNWVTEITHVVQMKYFTDEQRGGPYKFWHHKHFFKETVGGTEVEDIVHYSLPFGFLGTIINRIAVKKKLKEIFDFRKKKIEELFSKTEKVKV